MIVLDNGCSGTYRTGPVNLVISGMQIFQNEEEKASIVFVKLNKRKQYIQKSIAKPAASFPYLDNLFMVYNISLIIAVGSEDIDSTVNPYSKFVNEIFFRLCKRFACGEIDNIFRLIFAEYQLFSVYVF